MQIVNFSDKIKKIENGEQAVIFNSETGEEIHTNETNGFKMFESLNDGDFTLIFPATVFINKAQKHNKTR